MPGCPRAARTCTAQQSHREGPCGAADVQEMLEATNALKTQISHISCPSPRPHVFPSSRLPVQLPTRPLVIPSGRSPVRSLARFPRPPLRPFSRPAARLPMPLLARPRSFREPLCGNISHKTRRHQTKNGSFTTAPSSQLCYFYPMERISGGMRCRLGRR